MQESTDRAALPELEKLPIAQIRAALAVSYQQLTEADIRPFRKVTHVIDEFETSKFQYLLDAKEPDDFKIFTDELTNLGLLARLIRQLSFRINDSFLQKNYARMLEQCLFRVMKLSTLKEGLAVDPEILKEALTTLGGYLSKSDLNKFLLTPSADSERTPLYRYMQRCLRAQPNAFESIEKIRAVMKPIDEATLPFTLPIFRDLVNGTVCSFSAQSLFERYMLAIATNRLAFAGEIVEHLLRHYGDEINVNASYRGVALFSAFIQACAGLDIGERSGLGLVAIDSLLERPELIITLEDIEVAKDATVKMIPSLSERLQEAFTQSKLRKIRAIARGEISEDALGINRLIEELGNQLTAEEKVLLHRFGFLGDAAKKAVAEEVAPPVEETVELDLNPLINILEKQQYSRDVNIQVEILGPQIQKLPAELKAKLCRHDLTEDIKVLLRKNGFAALLTLGNEARGIAERVNHLRRLQTVLREGVITGPAWAINSLILHVGSAVKTLSPSEVRKLCARAVDHEMQDFLSENVDCFKVCLELVTGYKSFITRFRTVVGHQNDVAVFLIRAFKDNEITAFREYFKPDNEDYKFFRAFWTDAINKGQCDVLDACLTIGGVEVNEMLAYAQSDPLSDEKAVEFLKERVLMRLEGALLQGEFISDEALNVSVRLLEETIHLLTPREKAALSKRTLEAPTLEALKKYGFKLVDLVGAMVGIRNMEARQVAVVELAEASANVVTRKSSL